MWLNLTIALFFSLILGSSDLVPIPDGEEVQTMFIFRIRFLANLSVSVLGPMPIVNMQDPDFFFRFHCRVIWLVFRPG